jgi:hypothetical protein
VQVLDISAVGVLLRTSGPLEVGDTALLRLTFASMPFAARVIVRHVNAHPEQGHQTSYRVGASFIDLDPDGRRLLEQWHSSDQARESERT